MEAQALARWISAQDHETLAKMVMFLATKGTKSLDEVKARLNAAKVTSASTIKLTPPAIS
jgi:hypothetical protein